MMESNLFSALVTSAIAFVLPFVRLSILSKIVKSLLHR